MILGQQVVFHLKLGPSNASFITRRINFESTVMTSVRKMKEKVTDFHKRTALHRQIQYHYSQQGFFLRKMLGTL